MFEDTPPARKRALWLENMQVRFEIVKALSFKELQYIGEGLSVRWLNAWKYDRLKSILEFLNLHERQGSFYMSLDHYNFIPLMSFNLQKRKAEYAAWAGVRMSHVTGYDLGFDLDYKKGSWIDAIPDNEKLRALLDSFGVRYANFCSGGHGFHFIIPFEDMPEDVKALEYEQRILFYKKIAEIIAEKIKSVDLSVYMPTRVFKAPYTIEKNNRVIWPLDAADWQELKEKKAEMLDPLYLLNFKKIRDRGVFLQGGPDGIKNFIKNWEGWQ